VDVVRTVSDYLGDEVVLAVPKAQGHLQLPVMVAEQRKPGLKEYLEKTGGSVPDGSVRVIGNLVMIGGEAGSGFEATDFGKRIAQSYASGAGWLFAADMEQILPKDVNVQYVIAERKQNLGRTENSATVSFKDARKGIANWIAAPAPMGTLDFVSPEATFAASFVVNRPRALLEELSGYTRMFGSLDYDIAETLGGEMTIAVDGPLLPTPSWKVAVEVNNPARLEWSIEQVVKKTQQSRPEADFQLTNETVGGLTYYTLSSAKSPIQVHYVFTDGYLLIAPNQNLLASSIQSRTSGTTLTSSTTFRQQLPQNGQMNFSALVYYNASVAIAPMADQLTQTKFLTAEQKKALAALTADREPTLIYAYAEPEGIVAATRGSFYGLGLDTLIGLNGAGAGDLVSKLMGHALEH
jgi:hypothetical protein